MIPKNFLKAFISDIKPANIAKAQAKKMMAKIQPVSRWTERSEKVQDFSSFVLYLRRFNK